MNKYKILFFFILTLLAIYSLYRTYSDVRIKAKTIDDLALSVEQIKQGNKVTKEDIARKKTRDFIEFEAVSQLGLAREGQKVIVVQGDFDKKEEINIEEINEISVKPFEEWKKLFFKNNPLRH